MRGVLKPTLGAAFVLSPNWSAVDRAELSAELSAGVLRHPPHAVVSTAPTQDAGLVENGGLGRHS